MVDYKFILTNDTEGTLELMYAPDGWGADGVKYVRNMQYKGLFRKVTVNELSFVRDGKTYVDDVYDAERTQGVITITIKELNRLSFAYDTIFTGLLDLTTYKKEEYFTHVQIIDTTFNEKVKSRENTKVNLRSLKTIEDETIAAFTDETPELTLPDIETIMNASWENDDIVNPYTAATHNIPLEPIDSDFTESQSSSTGGIFVNSTAARTISVSGVLGCIVSSITLGDSFRVDIIVYDGVSQTINLYDQPSYAGSADDLVRQTINETVVINSGESIKIQVTMTAGVEVSYDIDSGGINYKTTVSFSETIDSIASSSITAYPVYEAFLRCIQILTGDANPFYSTKFGRTDSELTTYTSDGELVHITKGLFIREMNKRNNAMSVSLRELFDSMNALFNIGMGVEKIGGVDKVVVETFDYWFDSTVILDYSERVDEDKIEMEAYPDFIYNRIKVGYDSYDYQENGGLLEFNAKSEYSTVIRNIDNLLDIICKFRADTAGIRMLRKEEDSSEDVGGEDDIFLFDCKRGTGIFQAVTNDNYDWVSGGFDAEQSFNLDFSPARNIRKHGALIRAGLELDTTSKLKWQTSEKNSQLESFRTGDSDAIDEDADILVSDLEESYWIPDVYTCEVPFTQTDLAAVEANPKGIIKLADGIYGWILEINSRTINRTADVRLLRVNTNKVTPDEL